MENIDIVFCIEKGCKTEFSDFVGSYIDDFISSIIDFKKKRGCHVASIRFKYLEFCCSKNDTSLINNPDKGFDIVYSNGNMVIDNINHFNFIVNSDYETQGPLQNIFSAILSDWHLFAERNKSLQIILVYSKEGTSFKNNDAMDRLFDVWEELKIVDKKLILYTLEDNLWECISCNFTNTISVPIDNDFEFSNNLEHIVGNMLFAI